ncbi:MAG: CGNR zinc finger domain-containing protein [Actinomycetota bacterium]|nr:CGNR zinc finger domain-containing protein [Nocardioidaceae bacterium]MDQ3592809.1 CGNR zinc finger domain-containing protein [Actinomycetota bacterium]
MDFVRYAERAARLVNARLEHPDDLPGFLADRDWLVQQLTDRDHAALRRFSRELRPVFQASSDGAEDQVVARLNALLARHPVTPYIAGHDAQSWHLHVGNRMSSVAELLIAEALMGLAVVVCDAGALRLGVCQAAGCSNVFVDTSPNQSRRYCSERCSSRSNVAAYRARQRAERAEKETV